MGLFFSKWLLVDSKVLASSWGAPTLEVLASSAAVPPCGSHKVDVLSWVSFDRRFHVVGTVNLGLRSLTLSKKSSNRQWYCGLTIPVFGFKTRQTFCTCLFDGPRWIPILHYGLRLGNELPDPNSLDRANTGAPNTCSLCSFISTRMELNCFSCEIPPSSV